MKKLGKEHEYDMTTLHEIESIVKEMSKAFVEERKELADKEDEEVGEEHGETSEKQKEDKTEIITLDTDSQEDNNGRVAKKQKVHHKPTATSAVPIINAR